MAGGEPAYSDQGVTMFNPEQYGYALRPDFDKKTLARLLNHFEGEVKQEKHRALAQELRNQLLNSDLHR